MRRALLPMLALIALAACGKTTQVFDPYSRPAPPKGVLGAGPGLSTCRAVEVKGSAPHMLDVAGKEIWGVSHFAETQTFHRYAPPVPLWNATPFTKESVYGLDALSATTAWVVGSSGGTERTAVFRYDNGRWSRVPSPSPSSINNLLYDVSFASPTSGWAVGEAPRRGDGPNEAFLLQWDGKVWRDWRVPLGGESRLNAVKALSPTDAIAVGFMTRNGRYEALVLRYNGKTWARQTIPSRAGIRFEELVDVDASSAKDVWTTGYSYTAKETSSFVVRFDGKAWSTVPLPRYGVAGERGPVAPPYGPIMTSIDVTGPSQVWLGGFALSESDDRSELFDEPLLVRRQGNTWQRVDLPDIRGAAPLPELKQPLTKHGGITSVAATSSSNAVIVGFAQTNDQDLKPYTFDVTC